MYILNSLVYIPRDYEVKKDNAKRFCMSCKIIYRYHKITFKKEKRLKSNRYLKRSQL